MKKIILCVILILVIIVEFDFAAQNREAFTLASADLKTLRIDCGAGYLKVQGVEGLGQIEVTAVVDVRGIAQKDLAAFQKEYIVLKLEKVAGRAELTAKVDLEFSLEKLFGGDPDVRIDLDVRLPRELALDIDDGSGDIDIRDCGGSVALDDGSGDIRMTHIQARVEIEDGSGEIVLTGINGLLRIDDGSGDIELEDAGGDVMIDDGSGQINLKRVLGSVTIDDGSGDIMIDGVEKDVTIEEAGSGGVSIRNVKGKVRE